MARSNGTRSGTVRASKKSYPKNRLDHKTSLKCDRFLEWCSTAHGSFPDSPQSWNRSASSPDRTIRGHGTSRKKARSAKLKTRYPTEILVDASPFEVITPLISMQFAVKCALHNIVAVPGPSQPLRFCLTS